MSESAETFEQQLALCLAHLYDYAFLHNHPLVAQVAPEETGASRVHRFREQIAEMIERLRPAPNVPFHAKAARTYNVLSQRYLDQQETETVMQQLALSRRQYFREHAKALESLATMVRESLDKVTTAETARPGTQSSISVETEIASLSQHGERSAIQAGDLLSGVAEAAERLAIQRGVRLKVEEPPAAITLEADRTILRQALLSLLSFLITHTSPNTGLVIHCAVEADRLNIHIKLANAAVDLPDLAGQESLQAMIKTLGASLSWTREDVLTLAIPFEQASVLVIDDNPDVIDLFRRYLANQPYQVLAAQSGDQALHTALEKLPDVIILDVMLPKQDGYELLQKFKNHPRTQHIPILVCSVLDTVDLALSLGADGYLKKPPGQPELLKFLAEWLD